MVQIAPRRKGRQHDGGVEARFQDAIRMVDELPTTMLPKLVNHAMKRISHQLEVSQSPDDGRSHAATAASAEAYTGNRVGLAEEQPSGFDLVIAQGGPMAEVARMLQRDNLTDEERQQMKQTAYEAWRAMPPSNVPPPTDEEIEQMRDERRMKKYGR